MPYTLYFATHNAHKLEEVNAILCDAVTLKSLDELGCYDDIPETGSTLQENALQKAQYIHDHYQVDCFADDTGLEVLALDGTPGVHSARYAGEPSDPAKNREKLLQEMQGVSDRRAQFRTVIALIINDEIHYFEGIVKGQILESERGGSGFGYDCLFVPDGYDKTFAELSSEEKNAISHRGRAMQKLNDFLSKQQD